VVDQDQASAVDQVLLNKTALRNRSEPEIVVWLLARLLIQNLVAFLYV
jgi:hypothetical protein